MKRVIALTLALATIFAPLEIHAEKHIHRNMPTAALRTIQADCYDLDTGLPSTFDKTGEQPVAVIDDATSTSSTGVGLMVRVSDETYQVTLTQSLVSVAHRHIKVQFLDEDVVCNFEPVQVVGVWSGTAQAGTSTTITLDSSASATNNLYGGYTIEIISGTGVNQLRQINSYVGSTKVATINRAWTVTPDATSVFIIR